MMINLLLSYRLKVKAAAGCGIVMDTAASDLCAKNLGRVIPMIIITLAVSVPLITLTFSVQLKKKYIRIC